MVGFLIYVLFYSYIMKRKSHFSTIIGAISGSMPIVIGFCSVSKKFNFCAILLFFVLFFWQIFHFYAISIFYAQDYINADIPTFFEKYGIKKSKICVLLSIFCFFLFCFLLFYFKYVGFFYFLVMFLLAFFWIIFYFLKVRYLNNFEWAKKVFIFSIFILFFFDFLISIDFFINKIFYFNNLI